MIFYRNQDAVFTLTEALALGNLIIESENRERQLYSQKQFLYHNPEQEYMISLIADCYKQKYNLLIQKGD